ncbi:MAG: HAD family phosphatase [Erysipelotrichaceae bacterium]|nr:HAD family phosphatase [Erysipelotrichaceae bacterium]
MIRLVAADLDGTIIQEGNVCDLSVGRTLKRLKERDILFAVCTGRPVSSMRHMLAGWGIEAYTDYIVGSNGGEVLNISNGEMTVLKALDVDTVRDIIDLYEPEGLIPTLYTGSTIRAEKITPDAVRVAERVGAGLRQGNIRELLKEPQVKYMFILEPENMERALQFAADHPDPRYTAFKTAPDLLEMTDPSLDKGTGLAWVMEKEGISPQDTVVFGDNSNDIPMFRQAGCSVCMQNGSQDALLAAKYTAGSVDENGFANWLNSNQNDNVII